MYRSKGLMPFSFTSLIIASGVVAKALMLLDHTHFIDRFNKHPLIIKCAWKAFIYGTGSLLIRLVIRVIPFAFEAKSDLEGIYLLIKAVDLYQFIGRQLWYILLFAIHVVIRELIIIISPQKTVEVFFRKKLK